MHNLLLYVITNIITYQDTEYYERTRIMIVFNIAASQEGKNLYFATIFIDIGHSQRQVINFRSFCFHCDLP